MPDRIITEIAKDVGAWVGGGLFGALISIMTFSSVFVRKDNCKSDKISCQAHNREVIDAFMGKHDKMEVKLDKITLFMGKVEEHMRAANARERDHG